MTDVAPDEKFQRLYEQLQKVRASKTVELKPTKMFRETIIGFDGKPQPFKLRYYQSQGIYHLLVVRRMVLGDGTGLGKCAKYGTLIVSSDGLVPIESFAPSFLNLNEAKEGFYDMDRHVEVWTGHTMARVSRFYWGGKKPTLRITTRNGFQFEGTLVHSLRVRGSEGEAWSELQALNEGDFLCIDRASVDFPLVDPEISFNPSQLQPNVKHYNYPGRLTSDLATLLGYVVAEGNRRPSGVAITQDYAINPDPHCEIRDLLLRVFGWSGNDHSKTRYSSIVVDSVGIQKFMVACGVEEVTSHFKQVPPLVMRGTRQSVRGFLSAFIEGEGSVAEGGVEVSSSSEQLIREVQLLLLRFGVVSTLSKKLIQGNPHTYWRLTFFGDDARIFQEAIGFRSSRKIEALRDSLGEISNPNKDLIPYSSDLVRDLKQRLFIACSKAGANDLRKGSGIKQFGESFQSTLKHIINGHRDPTYQWLRKLLAISSKFGLANTEEYQAVQRVVEKGFFYDPIVCIEPGEAEVMDIEVDNPDHCYVANGILSHNTVQAIGAMCYLWDKEPDPFKVIVVCPKSALRQWASEVDKFTTGIKPFIASGTLAERMAAYTAWQKHVGPAVLLLNYHGLVRDWDYGIKKVAPVPGAKKGTQPVAGRGFLDDLTMKVGNVLVVFDECTAFKNPSTKTHQTSLFLSQRAKRVWGLTATLLKNNLMEGFGIFQVIRPGTFSSKNAFLNAYCVTELQRIKGGAKIPIVVGYRNLETFRKTIDPFFYGRPKHAVSNELPALTTKEIICEFSVMEDQKYEEALDGVLELGDGEIRDYSDTKQLTSLIYAQEVCDSIGLLKFDDSGPSFEGRSAKESALIDLISEEFDGEKVIVYTRFAKMVDRLQPMLTKEGIKSVAITGKVTKDTDRKKAQDLFQLGKVDVIFITDAGSEAINLQAAAAMVFFDSPWSWGNYVQILGRMIRIGSPHQNVLAIHLLAKRLHGKGKNNGETLDHKVIQKLRRKKGMIDQVIGEGAVGALKFDRNEGEIKDLISSLRDDARK